jgi:predicted nucleic acid-binding protein
MQAGLVQVVTLTQEQTRFARDLHTSGALGLGECEALAYAREMGTRLLIEERKGRALARAHNITYVILQVFPLEGYIQGKLTYKKCIDLLDRIAVAMNSDLAILNTLKAAAGAIQREREGENG